MWEYVSGSDRILAIFGLIASILLSINYYKTVKNSISDVMDAEKPVEGIPWSKHNTTIYDENRYRALIQGTVNSFLIAYTMATTTQIVKPRSSPDIWYEYIVDIYGTRVWEYPLVGMFLVFCLLLLPLLLALVKKSLANSFFEFMSAIFGIYFAGWIGWLIIPY